MDEQTLLEQLLKLAGNLEGWMLLVAILAFLTYRIIMEYRRTGFFSKIYKSLELQSETNNKILQYLEIATKEFYEEISNDQAEIIVRIILENGYFRVLEKVNQLLETCGKIKIDRVKKDFNTFVVNRLTQDKYDFSKFKYHKNPLSQFFDIDDLKKELFEPLCNIMSEDKPEENAKTFLHNLFTKYRNQILTEIQKLE